MREGCSLDLQTKVPQMSPVCWCRGKLPCSPLAWHGVESGHLLARQELSTAPSTQLGEDETQQGEKAERGPHHAAGSMGSGKQRAPCLGDFFLVICREPPDAFTLN